MFSMTKHTAGPWEVAKDATPDYAPQFTVYAEESGDRVATAFQTEANAALIAAAPDMLAALEAVYAMLTANARIPIGDEWRMTRDAIAKATGAE